MGRQTVIRGISWHEVATIRARDVRVRVMFAVFVALAGAVAAHGAIWPFAWFAAAVSTQAAAHKRSATRNADRRATFARRRSRAIQTAARAQVTSIVTAAA